MEGTENGYQADGKRPSSIDWKRHSETTGLDMPIYLMARQAQEKKRQPLHFAKLLLCEKPENAVPCETCHACRRVASKNHPNVTMIEPDGQDIKKEQMSSLIMKMTRKGYEPGRKIYIISRADRMNVAAANTLLKFLEEPEGEVTAILLTDSYQSILPTIQSRCQRDQLSSATTGRDDCKTCRKQGLPRRWQRQLR